MDCDMWANNYIHTPLYITQEILDQSHMLISTEIKFVSLRETLFYCYRSTYFEEKRTYAFFLVVS